MENKKYYFVDQAGVLIYGHPTYAPRNADRELEEFIKDSEAMLCNILAPRQMGKTSLITNISSKYNKELDRKFIGVVIDLSLSAGARPEQIYKNILDKICQKVKEKYPDFDLLESQLNSIFDKSGICAGEEIKNFLTNYVLNKLDSKIVVFLDEIGTLVKLGMQNDFFAVMRGLAQAPIVEEKPILKNINFVLIGAVKVSDLTNGQKSVQNVGKSIELSGLESENCEGLRNGLKGVIDNTEELFDKILYWTGGQPFLTQLVCSLVVEKGKIPDNVNIYNYLESLIDKEVVPEDWREKPNPSKNFKPIEDYFDCEEKSILIINDKIKCLNLYQRILLKEKKIRYDKQDNAQLDLKILGLVINTENSLEISNQIYAKVFANKWIQDMKNILTKKRNEIMEADPLKTIDNRDVYMLLDYSTTMRRRDSEGGQTRWESLKEWIVESHVADILDRQTICDSIPVYLFGRNMVWVSDQFRKIGDVEDFFEEFNTPNTPTFVVPALRHCLDKWFESREQTGRKGAFFILYTDGKFSDIERFEQLITDTCLKLENSQTIKIIVIGIGTEINEDYFNALDKKAKEKNKDKNGHPCDIVDFEAWVKYYDNKELDPPSIIDILEREIAGRDE